MHNIFFIVLIVCVSATANSLYQFNGQTRDVGLTVCENLYGLMAYPRIIQNITLLRTSPLRIRVYLVAQGPSRAIPFSVEGMVCQVGFDQNAANAACRSQNFNNAVLVSNIDWQEPPGGSGQECIMNTDSYKSVIPCEYIMNQINCPESAVNLAECRFPPLFSQTSSCNRHTHVGLICT
ncbi:unnamed protein product [Adineta ricciae]|uniref:SRCR domain-containing protein n=1 Tax=Adineta ricciae TaxID=249248 RepID=A0A814TN11_ADIRI|nr:unnamed protein product [Adineta ricciae]CAF1163558.1 unnamed protein product [Adineta ricciae]